MTSVIPVNNITKILGSLLLTYTTHYVATNLYSNLCLPTGIWGFLQGMINTGSPMCTTTLHFVSATQASYATILTVTLSRLFMDVILPGDTKKVDIQPVQEQAQAQAQAQAQSQQSHQRRT